MVVATDAAAYVNAPSSQLRDRGRLLEAGALGLLLIANWVLAERLKLPLFSYTSLGLFAWGAVLLIRVQPRGAVLALPLLLTRGATLVSLLFIEGGAYMPELGRTGAAGDASASFTAYSALLFLTYALVFSAFERVVTAHARSPFLDRMNAVLRWAVILGCVAMGALAALQGLRTGFPLLEGIDRFYYRRFLGAGPALVLLDNKTLFTALLGAVTFSARAPRLAKLAAGAVFIGMTGLFFLFGDKFFTVLTATIYFTMPYLLRRDGRLLASLAKLAPIAAALFAIAMGATLYIYSDYGAASAETAMKRIGERAAGQGELWFVATQDNRLPTTWDQHLVSGYLTSLSDPEPAQSAFTEGVETYYFIFKYSPHALKASFKANQGWVQLTMGFEAMGLVMFGYWGVALLVVIGGAVTALPALYLYRAFRSEFPLSILFAMWMSLQAYVAVQQGSLWPVAARGQLRRFLLFAIFETVLFALNRGLAVREPAARAAPLPPNGGPARHLARPPQVRLPDA